MGKENYNLWIEDIYKYTEKTYYWMDHKLMYLCVEDICGNKSPNKIIIIIIIIIIAKY